MSHGWPLDVPPGHPLEPLVAEMGAWRPPAKRHKRRLGACEITLHALDSYLTRWPGATVHTAREALGKAAAKATFVRRGARGEEIWEHEGLRLVVHRIARRPPIVLSVLVERGET